MWKKKVEIGEEERKSKSGGNMEDEKAREDEPVFLRFFSITVWNNELHLILTVRGENHPYKHLNVHVCLSLMLAHECVAWTHRKWKHNYCMCCYVVMLQLQVSGLLPLDLVFKLQKPNSCVLIVYLTTKSLKKNPRRVSTAVWVPTFLFGQVLSLFAQWLGVKYSGLLGATRRRSQDKPFRTSVDGVTTGLSGLGSTTSNTHTHTHI